jgi:hypothetical protein
MRTINHPDAILLSSFSGDNIINDLLEHPK